MNGRATPAGYKTDDAIPWQRVTATRHGGEDTFQAYNRDTLTILAFRLCHRARGELVPFFILFLEHQVIADPAKCHISTADYLVHFFNGVKTEMAGDMLNVYIRYTEAV